MKLQDLKGTYDATFSLGDLCLTSIQLQKNDLRPFSGVLDWMGSPSLSDVNRLLRNRFIGFMDLANLRIIGYANEQIICVSDDGYHIVSSHDFSTNSNTLTHLGGYPQVKAKFDRRIQRFLEKTKTCHKLLFVRTEGSIEQAAELQKVLTKMVAHDFRVLLVNHTNVDDIIECDWPLEKICAIELPNVEIWNGNNHLWQKVFEGISLSSEGSQV